MGTIRAGYCRRRVPRRWPGPRRRGDAACGDGGGRSDGPAGTLAPCVVSRAQAGPDAARLSVGSCSAGACDLVHTGRACLAGGQRGARPDDTERACDHAAAGAGDGPRFCKFAAACGGTALGTSPHLARTAGGRLGHYRTARRRLARRRPPPRFLCRGGGRGRGRPLGYRSSRRCRHRHRRRRRRRQHRRRPGPGDVGACRECLSPSTGGKPSSRVRPRPGPRGPWLG